MGSSLNELINTIRAKSALMRTEDETRENLSVLFMKALRKTVFEIQNGADSDDFTDLTVINLIILGDKAGYSADEMRSFIDDLKENSDDTQD